MAKPDLSADIAGLHGVLHIDPAIMIAAGIYCFPASLEGISDYLGAVVTKSIGPRPRDGNETPVFSEDINAMGLPNPGCKAFAEELTRYHFKKPLIVSIFGDTEDEVSYVASTMSHVCDALELNISCPNIKKGEKTGVTVGSKPDLTSSYTKAARDACSKPLIVKLSPAPYIFDRDGLFLEIADAAIGAGADALSAINTIPGAMRINLDAEVPVLTARYGGLSGDSIRPIGVGCIYTLYEHLKKTGKENDIQLIGIGGISLDNPDSFLEYIMAGASAAAFGTAAKGMSTEALKNSLQNWKKKLEYRMNKLGFDSLENVRGIAHGQGKT